jgi:cell division septation protein DedD
VASLDSQHLRPTEDESERAAATLDDLRAAVVLGSDPVAAARAALSIGRVQARRRRVAVGDLVGELAPIEELVPAEAIHGLVDSFLYGVSLSKVAYPVDPARNLFVLPSGAMPLDQDAMLRSDRWQRIVDDFGSAGALLLLVAPPDAPSLGELIAVADGVVLVGDVAAPHGARVLAHLNGHVAAERESIVEPSRGGAVAELAATAPAAVPGTRGRSLRVWLWLGIAVAAVLAVGAVTWATRRHLPSAPASGAVSHDQSASADSSKPSAAARPETTVTPAATRADTADLAGTAAAASEARAPVIVNPADSLASAAYAVSLVAFALETDAQAHLEKVSGRLPAVTMSPARRADGGRVYRVLAGAFRDRGGASSLLQFLRARGLLRRNRGSVVRTPIALLVRDRLAPEQASPAVSEYRSRGLPVYALKHDDGTVSLYAGAFESVHQTESLLSMFRTRGERPSVAYRIGRVP